MTAFKKLLSSKLNIKFIPFGIPFIAIFLLILVILIIGLSGFFYYQKINANPKSYTLSVIAQVGKLIDLPDETPSIATVDNPDKLKTGESAAFFKNAQKGDLLLIFSNSKKLILYRPSIKKVIEIANAKLGLAAPSATPIPKIFKFVILNGTNTSGLASKMGTDVTSKITGAEVVGKENALLSNYPKTVVIDLSGQRSQDVQNIASKLGILIANMPSTETKPTNADFLIIIGADRAK